MRIDLLLVLSLENKDDLDGYQIIWIIAMRKDKLRRGIDRQLRGVLNDHDRQNTF